MKKIYALLSGILLTAVLLIGMISLFDKDALYSEREKRRLVQRPKLTFSTLLSGKYASDYDSYYADAFPSREKLLNVNRSLNGFYTFTGLNGKKDPQIVISGLKEAVEIAAVKLKEAGARRVIPLNVSGPFHSYLLEEAGEKLGKFLENIPVSEPVIPYVANVTAAYVTKAEDVKPLLTRQVSSSVRWQQSVETMLADGVDRFIEIGPGKTLAGFIRKINREATVINIEKFEDLEKLN